MAIAASTSLMTASLFFVAYNQSQMQAAANSETSLRIQEVPQDQQDQFKSAKFYRNFMGCRLNISVVSPSPEKYDTDVVIGQDGKLVLRRCFTQDFLMALEYSLNFTSQIIPANTWGLYNKNLSKWEGMLAHLVEGQAVIGLSSTFDRPSRRKLFYHSIPLYSWKFIAIFRAPPFKRDMLAQVKPFQSTLWLAIASWVVAIAIVVAILNAMYDHLQRPTLTPQSSRQLDFLLSTCLYHTSALNSHFERWCDWFLWSVSILCQRTMRHMPVGFSLKTILTSSSVAGAVLNIAFSGTLISFLTVSVAPISTLEQLLRSSFQFHALDFLLVVEGFREATSPKLVSLMSRLKGKKNHSEVLTAKNSLMGGSYVLLAHNLVVYEALNNIFTASESCLLNEIFINTEQTRLGPVVLRDSPYKRTIDYQILRMKQFGLNDAWKKRHLPRRPPCPCSFLPGDGIPLDSVLVAMCIFTAGKFTSLLLLLIELFTHWQQQRVVVQPELPLLP